MIKKLRAKHVPETAYLIMFTIFSAAAFIEGTTLTHVFGGSIDGFDISHLPAFGSRRARKNLLFGRLDEKNQNRHFPDACRALFHLPSCAGNGAFFHGHFHLRCGRSRLEKDSEMFLFHWSAFDVPFAFWRFVSHNS